MNKLKLEQPALTGTAGGAAASRRSPNMAPPARPLLTPEEYGSYAQELDRLSEIRDRDLPDLLREARTFVASDAAEEIIQIQEDQAVVRARIARLEQLLRTAVITDGDAAPGIVSLGCSVEVEYLETGRFATYRVAGVPSSSSSGAVSAASPLGAALMGRPPGERVCVELPHGRIENLRILAVRDNERAA